VTARRLDPDLEAALKKLGLGKMIPTMPEPIAIAEKGKMAFEELLLLLLRDEIRRASTAPARRAKEAGLDPDMRLERGGTRARRSIGSRRTAGRWSSCSTPSST
jgi:hypothetical protein